jgi:hypothetical protein
MAYGLFTITIFLVVLYFALIGVKATIDKYRKEHLLEIIRDLLKYLVFYIAVLLVSLGISGLLSLLLGIEKIDYASKLDAARWLAFLVIGMPVIVVIANWIRRDFRKKSEARNSPAWQIYLVAATTSAFFIWFIPLVDTLRWFSENEYRPRSLAQALVALSVWLIHLGLLRRDSSYVTNIHRFIGLATGVISTVVGTISILAAQISKILDIQISQNQTSDGLRIFAVAAPVALYYWFTLDDHGSQKEIRVYRLFSGVALPTFFFALAATFALGLILNWIFGEHESDYSSYFRNVPQQVATVIVLALIIYCFRYLVADNPRDDISRLFEYLISGISLIGVGIAGGWLIAGLFELNSFVNTFISGIAGLIVTFPIWRFEWHRCQLALEIDFKSEHESLIRKVYLYVMLVIPIIVAFISAVIMSYQLFKGILVGGFEWTDIKESAGSFGSALVIAIYQNKVFKYGIAKAKNG